MVQCVVSSPSPNIYTPLLPPLGGIETCRPQAVSFSFIILFKTIIYNGAVCRVLSLSQYIYIYSTPPPSSPGWYIDLSTTSSKYS